MSFYVCWLTYVEWHIRQALTPFLFADYERGKRELGVAPQATSEAVLKKKASKICKNGRPAHSYQTLLGDLATLTLNRVAPQENKASVFNLYADPTPLQQ